MKLWRKTLLVQFILLLGASAAWSFPDLVRHGYANCIACHVSPSGGGVLTDYGRSISKELLSMGGFDGEERAAYFINQPSWLKLGGDYRSIQTYLNTSTQKDARYFPMQTDVEAAVHVSKMDLVATAGVQAGPKNTPKLGQFLSRRHYFTIHPRDNFTVRGGKFQPQFGLNGPNHTIVTERNLGWDQGSETYNFEMAFLGEKFDFFMTAIGGRPDDPKIDGESGLALSSSYFLYDRFKIGASAMHGEQNVTSRDVAGVFGILGFTKHIYVLSEIDYQWKRGTYNTALESKGLASYQQLNVEPIQGLHFYFVHQLSYLDFGQTTTRADSYGWGFQIFPRPHFEFNGELRKERNLASSYEYYDIGWLLFHFYL